MVKLRFIVICAVLSAWWCMNPRGACFAGMQGSSESTVPLVAQADPAQSLSVTSCKLKTDSSFSNNLVVEAYVQNGSDRRAKDIQVTFVLKDPKGVTGDSGTGEARIYSYYSATINELMPRAGQQVTIATALANPKNINEGAKTLLVEIWRRGDTSSTPVTLQYYFVVKAASFSD
ncbi:MAG: hypothetical protein RDV48_19660 [Candidatus Eremiobacteraeota bacterium]|nr:hypothetical protein [Candidatus Eremiobacteraeota bacterium]